MCKYSHLSLVYENRELREFFKIWDEKLEISDCICTYNGKIYSKINGVKKENILGVECPLWTETVTN